MISKILRSALRVSHPQLERRRPSSVATAVVRGQTFVVKTPEMQDRGVEIINANRTPHGVPAKIVCRSVSHSTVRTTTGPSTSMSSLVQGSGRL